MTRHEITEPRQLGFEGVHKLKVVTVSGKVDVVGAEVDGPDGARGATVDITRVAGHEPVVVEEADGELTIRHGRLQQGLFGWLAGDRRIESDISISVPPDCLVDVSVVSGPLVVSNLHEHAKVQGVSGEITLAQMHGPTDVKTVSGSITAESVTDDFSAHTISGSVTVIALASSSTIKAGTTSGAITVDLAESDGAGGERSTDRPRVDLNCVSGAVIVRIPGDANIDVDMSTMHGRTVTSFDELSSEALWGGRAGAAFGGRSRKLSGKLGDGGGRIKARAVSGDMTLLRRAPDPDLVELDGPSGKEV